MLRRLIGEDVDLRLALSAGPGTCERRPGPDRTGADEPGGERARCHAEGRHLTIETANVELDESYSGRHLAVKPGPYVLLAVSDTGTRHGRSHAGAPVRAVLHHQGRRQGTGLGLSTVFGIVKQSGGSVEVYSEPGRGTSVKVYLPRIDQPVSWRPRTGTSMTASGHRDDPAGGRRRDGPPPGARDAGARGLQGAGVRRSGGGATRLSDRHHGDDSSADHRRGDARN